MKKTSSPRRVPPALRPILAALSLLPLAAAAAEAPPYQLASEDGKWNSWHQNDYPFFSSVFDARHLGEPFPKDNLTPRAVILNLGHDVWAAFDTELLRFPLIWQGEAGKAPLTAESMSTISYIRPTQLVYKGQKSTNKPIGTPILANPLTAGWALLDKLGDQPDFSDPRPAGPSKSEVGKGPLPAEDTGLRSLHVENHQLASLSYQFHGTAIRESLRLVPEQGKLQVLREVHIAPHEKALAFTLSADLVGSAAPARISSSNGQELASATHQGLHYLVLPPSAEKIAVQIAFNTSLPAKADPRPASREVPWHTETQTAARLSSSDAAYVVDDIALPLGNPWNRNPRLTDLAFLNDQGDAAAVTFDGDVWLISGLKGDLQNLRWRRFASGFHEPMSIVRRDLPGHEKGLFVFDRNGIWQLHDRDSDGLADEHELFCNRFTQTAETREYANSMELAPDGSFVISKGGQRGATLGPDSGSVLRVSPDGSQVKTLAWGFRQPFVGVHPESGLVTASDQQGEYIPTTPIHLLREGENKYHGFISSVMPRDKYPAPIADPMTWVPHPVNPSAITQVWNLDPRFGPLAGSCLIIGFNRPELLRLIINPRFQEKPQAAVHTLSRDFEFSPLNGTVNPADGQLYLTGFQNFATTAPRVSGLARYRHQGKNELVLEECTPMDKGLLLRFNSPLDEKSATSLATYTAERWNYKRSRKYGSPQLKPDGSPGSQWLKPSSVYLSSDQKSVFIGIPGMSSEVMQMRIGWGLKAQNGSESTNSAYFTPYELAPFQPEKEGFPALEVDLTPRSDNDATQAKPTLAGGKALYESIGCMACHSTDGSNYKNKVGPSWKGLYGTKRALTNGQTVTVDEAYLRESILKPEAKIARDFKAVEAGMPIYEGVLNETQIDSLILFIKSLK